MSDPIVRFEVSTTQTEPLEAPDLTSPGGPLPDDPYLFIQAMLLVLALLVVSYLAAPIILPIVMAFILKMMFQPGMRLLEKFRLPRSISALILIFSVFAIIVAIGAALSGQAAGWIARAPESFARIEARLHFLAGPLQALQTFLDRFDHGGASGPSITEAIIGGTQNFASGFFETLLILYFLLLSGDTFLRRLVETVPNFRDKRRIVEMSHQIEDNISAYLVTVTLMNAAVGIATGAAMWATRVGDPLLWGVVAFILNYVPIMGPAIGVIIFATVGLLTLDPLWQALLPVGLYLLIHVVEGETVTPILLARRFTLNPVLVIISLTFWFWMWGVPGAILAVPMLAIAKIICDGLRPLNALGRFLEG